MVRVIRKAFTSRRLISRISEEDVADYLPMSYKEEPHDCNHTAPPKKPKTESFDVHVELPAETAKLVNKFIFRNQHTRNSHGPMNLNRLVTMLLEDVAETTRGDETSWRGAHMSLVVSEHGYRA
jgi:hypothetical protein